MIDAELAERSPNLGRARLVDLAARFGREEIMAATISVQSAEKPVFCDRLMDAAQARVGPFLLAKERRGATARRIVERPHQVRIAPAIPPVRAPVLMDHHPPHRLARPLPPG